VARGHHLIFGCAHTTGSSTVAALVCSPKPARPEQPGNDLRLEYKLFENAWRADTRPPPGWKMQVFEVVPALSIATRLDTSSEYGTLDVDVIVDLEDWEAAWAPPVPLGRLHVSFPMDDGDEVDPKVRELAVFIASLVSSGRRVLVHCTEGLNRSGVVVARALMAMGLTASDAIDLVRRQRGPSVDGFPALGNDAFVDWLHREGNQGSP
jgi:hypothetical protein